MLHARSLSKRFGDQLLFEGVSFTVNPGERIGLIGPNGSGKTTLLRILVGLESPDSGSVSCSPKDLRLGYLPQGLDLPESTSVDGVLRPRAREFEALESRLARLAERLASAGTAPDPALIEAYDRTLARLADLAGAGPDEEIVLHRLGLADLDPEAPAGALSGGQKARLALARLLLDRPQALLLDEPTNHLDLAMLEWLEGWLAAFDGPALIVSHDRVFLDRTVTHVLDLDPAAHTVREYPGNYSDYLEQRLAEQERQAAAYRDQVDEIRRLRQDIARVKAQAQRVERSTKDDQQRRYAKKVARKAVTREKKLERYLRSDERVERPKPGWQMKLEFSSPPHLGQDVLTAKRLAVGYPGHEPLLQSLDLHVRAGARIALIGPNGSGKTTLVRTLAGVLDPLEGRLHLGPSVRPGYMAQEQEIIDPRRSALEAIRAAAPLSETDARAFLHFFLFEGDDPLRPASSLSYGERARLTLALLVAAGCNFLLLDEPINHLDIPSRTRFEQALAGFEGAVLTVVHDRYFIERFADELWEVQGRTVVKRET